jgi:hypothetical protein
VKPDRACDDVSLFLNDRILYRGRSAQRFRDPGFLGIVNAENDAAYLPLKKRRNELVLVVSELTGAWGPSAGSTTRMAFTRTSPCSWPSSFSFRVMHIAIQNSDANRVLSMTGRLPCSSTS